MHSDRGKIRNFANLTLTKILKMKLPQKTVRLGGVYHLSEVDKILNIKSAQIQLKFVFSTNIITSKSTHIPNVSQIHPIASLMSLCIQF